MFDDTTPFVEGISVDEAFLDVGGLRRIAGTPAEIAVRLRHEVRERVGLPISVGVARTKFLAKVASAVSKPDGLIVVPPGDEIAFLHPLPIERVWGVGAKTAAKLHARGMHTRRRHRRDSRRRRSSPRSDLRPDGTSTPCPTTATHARSTPVVGGDRSGRSAPSAARRARCPPSTPCSSVLSIGSRGVCARPIGSAAR